MTRTTAKNENGKDVQVLIGVPKWLIAIITGLAITVIASAGGAVIYNSRESAVTRAVFDVKTAAISETIIKQSEKIGKLSDAVVKMGLQINTLEVKLNQ